MSSETKWTKELWRVKYTKFSEVVTQNGDLVATVKRRGSLAELQDTARLIAKAPILAGIAQRLADIAEGLRNGNSAAEDIACRLADEARAALASARGEG